MPTQPAFKRSKTALALVIPLAFSGLAALPLVYSSVANAQTVQTEQQSPFNIPAGALTEVLNLFAESSGVYLSGDGSLTEGKNSVGLSGLYSLEQGLSALLRDTGIGFELNGKTITLTALADDDVVIFKAIKIEASIISESAYGPVEGYIATRSAVGSKDNAAIKEVPRSISVISAEQMTAQNVATLTEALRYTAGVFSEVNGVNHRLTDISARGFVGVDMYLDGMAIESGGFLVPDTYGLERVSVMRGPSSTLYGNGSLGGVVDMSTKKPTDEPLKEVELLVGTYDHREGRFDVSDTLAGISNLQYRLTGTFRDSGTQLEYVDDDSLYIAPAIAWQPNEATNIGLMAYYQTEEGGNLDLGLPLTGSLKPNPLGKVSNKTFFGEPDTDFYEAETKSFAWDIDHKFNDNWSIKHQARYSEGKNEFERHVFTGLIADFASSQPLFGGLFPEAISAPDQPLPDTVAFVPSVDPRIPPAFNVPSPFAGLIPLVTALRIGAGGDNNSRTLTSDTHLMGELMTGAAIKHNVLIGLDYSKKNTNRRVISLDGGPLEAAAIASGSILGLFASLSPLDVYNPVYGRAQLLTTTSSIIPREVRQTGLYVQDRITFNKKLVITFGARRDEYDDNQFDKLSTGSIVDLKESNTTYQGGINYLFDSGFTPYLSYSESFMPQTGKDFFEKAFEPTTGTQYEVGLKYELPDQTLSATLSYFDLARNNLAITDPDPTHLGCFVGNAFSLCSILAGEVVSSGVELEVKATPIPELNIMASFSTNDVHTTVGSFNATPSLVGKSLVNQPKKQGSLWAKYRFYDGVLEGFGISAGARYVGATFADAVNTLEVPSYSVFDMGLFYTAQNGFDFAINASNVTDKQYLASCNTGTCSQGLARKITGSAIYRW